MDPPAEPNKEDCCNSGCNPCIFDVYEKHLKLYKNRINLGKDSVTQLKLNGISQLEYKTFYVTDILKISNTLRIMKFKSKERHENKKVWWNPGDHFLVKYNVKSCTKAYTPIKSKIDFDDSDFFIVIKKYDTGKVSKYLFNLNIGDETFWRGPYGSYKFEANKYARIIMIAQGTGLAPFISIIEEILEDEENITKVILFFCCHDVMSILFRDDLYTYKEFWNFKYQIFISNISNEIIKYEEPIIKRKLSFKDFEDIKPCENNQFLICGSNQFMSEFKTCFINNNIPQSNIVLF